MTFIWNLFFCILYCRSHIMPVQLFKFYFSKLSLYSAISDQNGEISQFWLCLCHVSLWEFQFFTHVASTGGFKGHFHTAFSSPLKNGFNRIQCRCLHMMSKRSKVPPTKMGWKTLCVNKALLIYSCHKNYMLMIFQVFNLQVGWKWQKQSHAQKFRLMSN